jgi:leucine dehydrogenase
MGAILNDESIANLSATIVAGGANNQLAELRHAQMLHDKGILYAPDYVINAGGIIEICRQFKDESASDYYAQIEAIDDTLTNIYRISEAENRTTSSVADAIAESRFLGQISTPKNSSRSVSDAA